MGPSDGFQNRVGFLWLKTKPLLPIVPLRLKVFYCWRLHLLLELSVDSRTSLEGSHGVLAEFST